MGAFYLPLENASITAGLFGSKSENPTLSLAFALYFVNFTLGLLIKTKNITR